MKRQLLFAIPLALIMGFMVGPTPANAEDDMVYGRELMTQKEVREHKQKMRTLNTEEQEQYRKEHHEMMKERAKEQGKAIPDEPLERRRNMQNSDSRSGSMGGGPRSGGMGGGMGGGRR